MTTRAVAAAQRAERHRVRAEAVGAAPHMLPTVLSGRRHAYRATVRRPDPAGEVHTARARAPAGTRRGDTVDVWLDSRGRTVLPPPSRGDVRRHSLAVGTCAASGRNGSYGPDSRTFGHDGFGGSCGLSRPGGRRVAGLRDEPDGAAHRRRPPQDGTGRGPVQHAVNGIRVPPVPT